ncbi:DUF4214 domain-containing protein [Brevundimonas goettingensis]|uniref:DUF4214 domain-containing protein n=1 Tax=Brevundimonas goettingensis TaxID=2774190 RepID=A0A975C4L0_9CAUL|nr:DUF4214 domain-containing protein [Brevundimonas goettingensis]QTC91191.1 DUF4214 domain-containing protein [Brevundimonas goettingensis]
MPTILVRDTTYEVGEGQSLEFVNTPAFRVQDPTQDYGQLELAPHLINRGTIWAHSNAAPFLSGTRVIFNGIYNDYLTDGGDFFEATFVNTVTGVMRFSGETASTDVFGFFSGGGSADFQNDGVFIVESLGDATALSTYNGGVTGSDSDYMGFEFLNSGRVTVTSDRNASGIMMYNGGLGHNSGLIDVRGSASAIGVLIWGHHSEFLNTGTITAQKTSGTDTSIGISVAAGVFDSHIFNSGLISAAVAITERPVSGGFFPVGNDWIENTGEIRGDITLYFGTDRITNTGLISGNISFASGDDLFLGGEGRLVGRLSMGDGDDRVFSGTGNDDVFGGAGRDEIHAGSGADAVDGGDGDDLIFGDAGDDRLTGGAGRDLLFGGDGADILYAAGGDTLIGGAGSDRLVLSAGADEIVLGADGGDDIIEGFDAAEDRFALGGAQFLGATIEGADTRLTYTGGSVLVRGATTLSLSQWNALATGGSSASPGGDGSLTGAASADDLIGDARANRIEGGAGADRIFGEDGDDLLIGGTGDDLLAGGRGWDRLEGGDGNDRLVDDEGGMDAYGGAGDDIIAGGVGNDRIDGGVGGDLLSGGIGNDVIDGGADADTIDGGDGDDTLYGGSGANLITGGFGHDIIYGGDDGERLIGDYGDDEIHGGGGNDNISGGWDDDILYGDAGHDTIDAGGGTDLVHGGDGDDVLSGDGLYSRFFGEAGNDVINSRTVEGWLYGGEGNDKISNTGGSRGHLFGGDGNDTLLGSGTGDILQGGDGDDTIYGGLGNSLDIVDYSDARSGITLDLRIQGAQDTGGSGRDYIGFVSRFVGSNFADNLIGSSGAETFNGAAGDDLITGGGGNDTLDGGAGSDTAVFSGLFSAYTIRTIDGVTTVSGTGSGTSTLTNFEFLKFADRTVALASLNVVNGTASADTLSGTTGNDVINGLAGNDILNGLAGNDVLTGGAGSDQINGGDGIDTAAYAGIRRQYGTANSSTVVGGPEGGADTLTSIENARFVDGTLTFDVDSASAQVMRLYDAALGRHYDEAGLEGQAAWIANGTITLRTLADAFVHSAEFLDRFGALDNRTFIEQLYRFSLGRDGEPEGVNGWTASLNAGMSRGDVVIGFSESAEHRGLTQAVLNQGLWVADQQALIIARLYDATFDRLPDSAGLIGWTASLKGGMALSQIASGFADSPEFQARYGGLSNWDFVAQLFRFCLNREGDPAGIQNWVNNIDAGLRTRAQVLLEFSESQEHVNLTTPNMLAGIQTFDYHSSPAEVVGDAAAKAAAEPLVLPTLTSEDGPGDALVLPAVASEDAAIKDVALTLPALTLPALIHDDAFVLPAEVALEPLVLPFEEPAPGDLKSDLFPDEAPVPGHDVALTLPEWTGGDGIDLNGDHSAWRRVDDTGHWTFH